MTNPVTRTFDSDAWVLVRRQNLLDLKLYAGSAAEGESEPAFNRFLAIENTVHQWLSAAPSADDAKRVEAPGAESEVTALLREAHRVITASLTDAEVDAHPNSMYVKDSRAVLARIDAALQRAGKP